MKPIHSSEELINRAVSIAEKGRKKTVVVAAAQDVDVIGAVAQAEADGFLEGILVGDEDQIKTISSEHHIDIRGLECIHEPDVKQAAHGAVKLASEGAADAIMKGFLPTSALLRVVLDKQYGLRGENTLSHCAVLDIPGYHKLLTFTDGGMVVKPNFEQKQQILENSIYVTKALGISPVKVALSAATHLITETIPQTIIDLEALLTQMVKKMGDIILDGPLSLDVATSSLAAERAGIQSDVAGDADIFLVDSIEECNVVAKSLINFADAVFAGVIVGAKVPVSLVSRTDTIMNKKASLAITCLLADYYQEHHIWDR